MDVNTAPHHSAPLNAAPLNAAPLNAAPLNAAPHHYVWRVDPSWIGAGRCALIIALAIVALVLSARRGFGALERPLDSATLGGLAAVVAAAAVLARRGLFSHSALAARAAAEWIFLLTPAVSVIVIGLAVMVPDSPTGGLLAYWGIVAGAEFWTWRGFLAGPLLRRETHVMQPTADSVPQKLSESTDGSLDVISASSAADAVVWQRSTRFRTSDGNEVLEGWLRCRFEAGQRLASAHLAFCPPFSRQMRVDHHQVAGPKCRVKVSQLLLHGARFDVKLAADSSEPVEIVIECTVSENPVSR